jgi:hypothetical protein
MCRTFQLAGRFIANFRACLFERTSEREGTGARGVGSVSRGRARLVDRLFTPLRAQRVLLDAWFSAIGRSPSVVRCFVCTIAAREAWRVELLNEFLGVSDEPPEAVATAFGSSDPWKNVSMDYVTLTDSLTDVSVDPDDFPQAGE